MKSIILALFTTFSLFVFYTSPLEATCDGKIDIGPAFVHIDILEHGHTVKRMDMWAVRTDASYMVWKGVFVKPTLLYANGGSAKGGLFTAGFAIGHYTPINAMFAVSPQVGVTYSHLWTKIDMPLFGLEKLNEKFKALSPYLGIEICCKLDDGWRIYGSYQYAWSRSKTIISHIGKFKSNCEGPTYSFLIEKDLSDKWSVNFGGAYNLSLSKEKHGLRGTGLKAGIVRWF
ncbi:MAG: hypothetical protein H0U49_10355 [Parachlamydiaceae bacterium]|nr:hypothetical protein [Parachlamydiaceae bacterium]